MNRIPFTDMNWSEIISSVTSPTGAVALAMLVTGAVVLWLFRDAPPMVRLGALVLMLMGLALFIWLLVNARESLPNPRPVPAESSAAPAPGCERSVITVTSARYGPNCTANAVNATNAVGAECNGKSFCAYAVSHLILGDPCVGSGKEFRATYGCSGRPGSRTATVEAEATGYVVTLTCPPTSIAGGQCPDPADPPLIDVVSASYGLNCTASAAGNATNPVADRCDGQPHCAFGIDVATLGDPCVGTQKEFLVFYTCGELPRLKSEKVAAEANGSTANLACP